MGCGCVVSVFLTAKQSEGKLRMKGKILFFSKTLKYDTLIPSGT